MTSRKPVREDSRIRTMADRGPRRLHDRPGSIGGVARGVQPKAQPIDEAEAQQ